MSAEIVKDAVSVKTIFGGQLGVGSSGKEGDL